MALRRPDQRLLANAFLAVAAARVRLAVLPFHAGRGYTCRRARKRAPSSADRVAWAVDLASRHLGNATCLARALAAHGMLARRGLASCISIGVAAGKSQDKENGIVAHAWLETGGRILLGGPDVGRYTLLLKWCN